MPPPSEMGEASAGDGSTCAEKALPSLGRDYPHMLFLIADGKVVYANRNGERALGLGRSSGSEIFRMVAVAPEYLDLARESLSQRSRGEEVRPTSCALLTRDGRRIEGILRSGIIEREDQREPLGIFTARKPT
jgi:PAS domain-containing protein